jgi:hypothetical protein
MEVGKRDRPTKREKDEKQYDIYTNSIQDSRKNIEQR